MLLVCILIISIPYGSIKSRIATGLLHSVQISIPYGSIKRLFKQVMPAIYIKFQFLMVQLKALNVP